MCVQRCVFTVVIQTLVTFKREFLPRRNVCVPGCMCINAVKETFKCSNETVSQGGSFMQALCVNVCVVEFGFLQMCAHR